MSEFQTSGKRIAKNTFYLYFRMLMVMLVSLFTVRVVLNALGAEDYGINNVVGGIVTMFAFLTSTLNSASLRFFSFYIGKNDQNKLNQYFVMSFWCFGIMSLVIFVLAETIGYWFVINKLTIPLNRLDSAIWVYHLSIFTFMLRILAVPFNSIVIAHERMSMFAILGILECILKLFVAYIIYISPFDKLKTYSVLMFVMMAMIDCFYFLYGIKQFPECRIKKYWNSKLFLEIANYSGWSLFGAISGVIRGQGINVLLNMFFNPIINAARAIAFQVNSSINQFVMNFYKAVQPQITKSYGAGDLQSMHQLIYKSSRLCYFLILVLSIPVLVETDFILTLWLKKIPDNTILFTRLVILTAIVDSTSYPLQTSISATGKIRLYQFVIGNLLILNLPIAWILLTLGYPPEVTMYIAICLSFVSQLVRIVFAHYYLNLSYKKYFKDVIYPIVITTGFSVLPPLYLHFFVQNLLLKFCVVVIVSLLSTGFSIFIFGINNDERKVLKRVILEKVQKNML